MRLRTQYVLLLVAMLFATTFSWGRARTRRLKHRILKVYIPPFLQGSRDSMIRQNEEITRLQLPRIYDTPQLLELERTGELVPISHSVAVNPGIPSENRYLRPWAVQFLSDMGDKFRAQFNSPLIVSSAVRTVQQQHKLRGQNGNAAPDSGEIASSHLAGITFDLARRPLTAKQRKWVEDYLLIMKERQVIEVADERNQPCFHIMVYGSYLAGVNEF